MYQVIRTLQSRQYQENRTTLISPPMDIKTAKRLLADVYAKNIVTTYIGCTARLVLLPRMHRTV